MRIRKVSKDLKNTTAPAPETFENGVEEEDDLLQMWTAGFSRKGAVDRLRGIQGVSPVPRPLNHLGVPDDPQLPKGARVTGLSSEDLGWLHMRFVAMVGYFQTEVTLAELDSAEAQAFLKHTQARVRLRKTGTVPDKDAKTFNDREFLEAEMRALTMQAQAKLLRGRLEGYIEYAKGLSREMSRRENLPRE
jgi:hypothetical protein